MAGRTVKIAAAGAACLACCAPLAAPLLMPLVWSGLAGAGAADSGALAGLRWDVVATGAVLAAAGGGLGYWHLRRRRAAAPKEAPHCDLETCGPGKSLAPKGPASGSRPRP